MADVAARAGVSHQTVSRVLNNHPSVSPRTRQQVNDAILALDYRRNPAARALVTGTSQVIGVLVTSTMLSGPTSALLAIEQTARARGYWVSMAGVESHDPGEVIDVISHFTDQGVDGMIAVALTQTAVDATLTGADGLPTVLVTSGEGGDNRPMVDIDQAGGATQAITLLKGLGHRRIAHIAGPAGDLHAEARKSAWQAGVPRAARKLMIQGDWSSASGYRAALALLAGERVPTAIFAANDQMAIGALRALNERGLKVPGDISVVGFDDIEGADCSIPPLTTVRQNHAALGLAAMELLLEAIAGAPARSVLIPAEMVVRASAGPPPAD